MKRNVFLFISLVLFVGVFIIGISIPFSNSNSNEKETNDVVKEVPEDFNIANEELRTLTTTISEILQKDYDEIGAIEAKYKELITVRTSLDSSESNSDNIAQEIKKDVEDILKYPEIKSISNIDSYDIKVRNKEGKVIN